MLPDDDEPPLPELDEDETELESESLLLELEEERLDSDERLLLSASLLESDDEPPGSDGLLPELEEGMLLESGRLPLAADPLMLFESEPLREPLAVCEPLAWESSVESEAILEPEFDPDPPVPDVASLSLVDRLAD